MSSNKPLKQAICLRCNKEINLHKERYVIVETLQGNRRIEIVFFHIACWRDYFEDKVKEKFVKLRDKLLGVANKMVRGITQDA